MNRNLFIIVTLLAISMLAGCDRRDKGGLFRWSSAGAEADSIVTGLEWAFINNRPVETIDALTHRLDSLSKSDSDRVIDARVWFWKGRALMRKGRSEEAAWHLEKAMEIVDSAAYPYDAQRISHLKAVLPGTSASERYMRLKNAEKYYLHTSDAFMLAHVSADLGIMSEGLGGLRNPQEILTYYKTADSLYNAISFHEYQTKNQINLAQGYINVGDSTRGREIVEGLLAHPLALNDSNYYDLVLLSAGGWFSNRQRLYTLFHRTASRNPHLGVEGAILLHDLVSREQPDSARQYIEYAYRNLDHALNKGTRAEVLRRYAAILDADGREQEAYKMSAEAMALQQEYTEQNNLLDVARIGKVYEIERIEAAHLEALRERDVGFWLTVIGILTLVFIVASRFLVARQKERVRASQLQLESERKSRRLAATSLVMEEKEKVLRTLVDDIHQLGREGKLSDREVRMLEQNFRVHLSGRSEWEGFVDSFEKVNPGFYAELKRRYPGVSEGDLRLAAYIKMGMGQKQIARMLGVQPESVKKNRHRLRTRMGLGENDRLEDILRNI